MYLYAYHQNIYFFLNRKSTEEFPYKYSLHLIEHHTLEHQTTRGVCGGLVLQPPALLPKKNIKYFSKPIYVPWKTYTIWVCFRVMAFTRSPALWDMGRRQRPDRLTEDSGSLWDSGWRTGTSCNRSLVGEIDIIRNTNHIHIHTLKHKHTSEGTCEGIHEGGERAIEHLKEGVSTGEALRATQNRVLQNVRNTGAVHRSGTKLHTITTHEEHTHSNQ